MNPALVRIAGSGDRVSVGVDARNIDRGIGFDETRQLRPLGSYVPDLEQKIGTEGSLHVQIPVLRVRQGKVGSEREIGQRGRKGAVGRRVAEIGIGEIEKRRWSEADLLG